MTVVVRFLVMFVMLVSGLRGMSAVEHLPSAESGWILGGVLLLWLVASSCWVLADIADHLLKVPDPAMTPRIKSALVTSSPPPPKPVPTVAVVVTSATSAPPYVSKRTIGPAEKPEKSDIPDWIEKFEQK